MLTLRTEIGAFISVSVSKMSVSDLDISDCAYRMFIIIGKLAEWSEEFKTCNEIHSTRTMQSYGNEKLSAGEHITLISHASMANEIILYFLYYHVFRCE